MGLLLSPLTWILIAGAWLPYALRNRRRRRWSSVLCILLGIAGVLGAMPLGANLLIESLEQRTPSNSDCASEAASETIVVLAGGSDRAALDASDVTALGVASLRRTLSAVALWRSRKAPALVIIGGPSFRGVAADSELMRTIAETMGVPADVIRIETTSQNTWENARGAAGLLNPPSRISLVTSAAHMPRAAFAFEHAGFRVCPCPTDSRFVAFGLPGYLVPQTSAAIKTTQALHEWVGLAYYHWLAFRGD